MKILLCDDIMNGVKQNRSSTSELQPIVGVQTDGVGHISNTGKKARLNQYGSGKLDTTGERRVGGRRGVIKERPVIYKMCETLNFTAFGLAL